MKPVCDIGVSARKLAREFKRDLSPAQKKAYVAILEEFKSSFGILKEENRRRKPLKTKRVLPS